MPIDDPGDPRLDDFRELSRADRRPDRPGGRGLRDRRGRGRGAPAARLGVSRAGLLGVPRRFDELAADLARRPRRSTSPSPGRRWPSVVGFHLNRGVLAVGRSAGVPVGGRALIADSAVVAVLEGVGDHENLGALFRNAAAPRRRRRAARAGLRGPAVSAQRPGVHGHGADGAVRGGRRPGRSRWPTCCAATGFGVAALSPSGEVSFADADLAPPVGAAARLGGTGTLGDRPRRGRRAGADPDEPRSRLPQRRDGRRDRVRRDPAGDAARGRTPDPRGPRRCNVTAVCR